MSAGLQGVNRMSSYFQLEASVELEGMNLSQKRQALVAISVWTLRMVPCHPLCFQAKDLWHARHLSGQGGPGQSPSGEGM